MSGERRGQLLVGGALCAAALLVVAYFIAGGASYTPEKTRDPCKHRPWRDPEGIEQIAEQFSLSALDGAACKLGVTRETLARALATPESRERFSRRYGIDEKRLAAAIQAGLLRAIDDAEEAGALPSFVGGPMRETIRQIPIDEAIELIHNARSLLDNVQTFLRPAEGLLEQLLP